MPITKCCGYFSLEMGVIIIAVAGIGSGYNAAMINEQFCHMEYYANHDAEIIGNIVESMVMVLISILLLIAVYRKKTWVYMLVMIVIGLHIIFFIVSIITSILNSELKRTERIPILVVKLVASSIWFYFLIVIAALRKKQITEKLQEHQEEIS